MYRCPAASSTGTTISGVVEIDERDPVGAGQDRARPDEPGQEPGGDRVELADVPDGDAPQERSQRGRRPDLVEQPAHPAMPQQIYVIDGVRAGDHPGDQRENLHRSRRPSPRSGPARPAATAAHTGRPAPAPQPARHTTPDSDHRTAPTPRGEREIVASSGCSSDR
jgi:hypothetical protein